MNGKPPENMEFESTIGIQTFVMVLLAMVVGSLLAALVLPAWLPNLANSLLGSDPKAFWYLSRGSAFVALTLLWASMAFGLSMTNKMARLWPGAPAAFAMHEYISLLGLAFSIFHGLILLGDHYINFDLRQVIVPFAASSYRPMLVGFGQLGFYVWLMVALSFYIRPRLAPKVWRAIHYLSFLTYVMAFYHSISSGTDSATSWATWYYWITGGSLVFLLIHRIVMAVSAKLARPAATRRPAAPVHEAMQTVNLRQPESVLQKQEQASLRN